MSEKQKKPIFKRWWFIAIALIVIIGMAVSGGEDEPAEQTGAEKPIEQADATVEDESEEDIEKVEEHVELAEESAEDDVPREYRNALRSAQNYVNIMAFSKQGLFNQLTSEYGDQYPAEAAEYAIENVEVDYNEEALEAAENYLKNMPMSDQELFDQLTSEYGEQFTKEQAQYAINNLPE